MAQPTDFIVDKNDLRNGKFVPSPLDPDKLKPGQALLKVDKFALTANNVTYAVAGDSFSYWGFFPAAEGWGRVPVWGYGDVVASAHDDVKVGTRVYGYFPMSTHLLVEPENVTNNSFTDISAHRREIHGGAYNNYQFTTADPNHSPANEPQIMLFRGLFITGFALDDFLADNTFFGAQDVVIISASSKTGYSTAQVMKQNKREGVRIIGLTSAGNVGFVKGLGCYDQVVAYDDIGTLEKRPAVTVDMAGNPKVQVALRNHYADNLKYYCQVGGTHWEASGGDFAQGGDDGLPGAAPEIFFAPGVIGKRIQEWGAAGFQARVNESWTQFLPAAKDWVRIEQFNGPQAVEKLYHEMLDGQVRPDQGPILSLWED